MSREAFEAWWEKEGQFCRAGGGDYEKTFAFRAYEAARAAALEESAEACESEAENWRGEQSVIDFRLCAARIRALKEQG